MNTPNIILVLVDDMGWRDLGIYGSPFYETPNIDALARDGMRFTDAYASCPVCSPTRASILTGKYPARVGITNYIPGTESGKLAPPPYLHHLPLEETTIASALKQAGYRTYHVGKWHLGDEPYWPEHHGFDVNIGGCSWGHPKNGYFSPYGNPRLDDGPDGEYLTDRLTDEAIALLERNGDAPFFLHMSHHAVHTPIQVPSSYKQKYQEKAKRLGLDTIAPFEDGEHFPTMEKRQQRVRRRVLQSDPAYAGMIENLDENVGRLLAAVTRLGLDGNTVVFFYSDNGGLATAESSPTCNAPLSEGKGWMYEGGTRVDLIARWPGTIPSGTTCAVPVTSTDFYPTMLAIAGLPPAPEQHVDGTSILPLLRGGDAIDREAIYWHYPHYGNQGGTPGSSVRAGDHKLIEFFEDGRLELYNLRDDIEERHDLAATLPGVRDRLHAMLRAWREEAGARLPAPNPEHPYYTYDRYIRHEGPLDCPAGGPVSMRIPLARNNPQLEHVPVADLLDGYTGKILTLIMGNITRAGTFDYQDEDNLAFTDTHEEKVIDMASLIREAGLAGKRVTLRAYHVPATGAGPASPVIELRAAGGEHP